MFLQHMIPGKYISWCCLRAILFDISLVLSGVFFLQTDLIVYLVKNRILILKSTTLLILIGSNGVQLTKRKLKASRFI